ncbi:efflux RND transporter permease subunit [Oceanicoccus sagamiensis]|uniref:Acriflavin resistance protein n=1 Tax=Oceanicoccus sagamiensis TaxID=716816 RepID=A0A1X9N703_9GAMM|nr:efflux RND transporter permease subunit [Oceanicoccus sagamiensis]ARN72934.1 hypothetical protein BST96_01725 [Oceanicoccus sagamiensis]
MNNLIKTFVRNPVAPNLAMIVMVLAGLWASTQLTRQLLPAFALNIITISVQWPGAAAQDVEASLTQPIEDQLLGLDEVRNISSTSTDNLATVTLEYPQGTDMSAALNEVKNAVSLIRNLPSGSEQPQISIYDRNEGVSRIVLTGPQLEQLRPISKRFERELRARGLSRIEIKGLPEEEISIELPAERLNELKLSLSDIAQQVRGASINLPAGAIGEKDMSRQLRSLDQQRSVAGFSQLAISTDGSGRLLRLGDIATIKRAPKENSAMIFAGGNPAVEIVVTRSETEDAINVAENMQQWVEQSRADLPPNIELMIYDEIWRNVDERINLMTSNAATGLLLLLGILYLFLNGRVAIWVAAGIPVSILMALMALSFFGGTINVMTLFAMIMTLGIIVDDAIVVSEEAVTLYQQGASPARAAEKAAMKMLAPVTAASLTTIAAFLPLMTIGGSTGSILFAIPLVVICVVMASLLECFIVLPGHLHHSLKVSSQHQTSNLRRRVDTAFNRFRKERYIPAAKWCVANRRTTLAASIAGILFVFGLLGGGKVGFSFFPQPDGSTVTASARFTAGSPPERVEAFMMQAKQALFEAEQETGEQFIKLVLTRQNETNRGVRGSNIGEIVAELTPGDLRRTSNSELVRAWKKRIPDTPGLEFFLIKTSRGGVPGADIDLELTGASPDVLKLAAVDLQESIALYDGVSAPRDDLNYGKEQLIFELSSVGRALGLTGQNLGEQIRANFEGELIQIFQDQGSEVEVRVRLERSARESSQSLDSLPIALPSGDTSPLLNLANLSVSRGFDDLKHENGLLAVRVSADVDSKVNNANAIRGQLQRDVLPQLVAKYGISWKNRGRAQDQSESVGDIKLALPLSIIMIFIILAWVFRSYLWPVAVLSIIPFSIVGAIVGHWILGVDVTMLSLFGIFGLCGIVINDSIILIVVYQELREKGLAAFDAAVEAGSKRLRAVFLTSFTTIVGIAPLLFEQAEQAQFLKPMVISISFGLLFGTFIVLFLLPALLVGLDSIRTRFSRIRSDRDDGAEINHVADVLAAASAQPLTQNSPMTITTLSELNKATEPK